MQCVVRAGLKGIGKQAKADPAGYYLPKPECICPRRLISYNILLAYEVTHFMQNKCTGCVGYAALKLDMSKAYDRVEWLFLEKMMRKMGF